MKPREARHKVLIDARLRQGSGGWSDALILNLSSRGLMARAARAPERGSYVEMTRGSYRIVARVIWVEHGRFGALAQDVITLDAIAAGREAALLVPANRNNDRRERRPPSSAERLEQSRRWSRRSEFAFVVALGIAAAGIAFETVRDTLSKPLGRIEASFARRR